MVVFTQSQVKPPWWIFFNHKEAFIEVGLVKIYLVNFSVIVTKFRITYSNIEFRIIRGKESAVTYSFVSVMVR